jgi:glycosyltransferase involved in cell wall biosynthesis
MSASDLPSIAVITPSFRQAGYIAETIESVNVQQYPALEHWIVDAQSDDGTAEIVARYRDQPWLHWVSEPDRGQSDAINKGMRLAHSEIAGWLNADDTYFPGALQAVGAAFRDHPEAQVVYGGGVKTEATGKVIKEVTAHPYQRRTLQNLFYVLQPSLFFRRSLFLQVDGLNEDSHYAMDWELMLKFPPETQVVVIPQLLSRLRCYPNTKTETGGWKRMREIAEIGRKYNGPLDRNHLCFCARELVSRLPLASMQKVGKRMVDGLSDKLFGWDGYMVRGWPEPSAK